MKKSLMIIFLLMNSAYAGTLDCKVYHGFLEDPVKLTQTSFAEDDPEEFSETYEVNYKEVKAYALYLPFQDGATLFLTSLDGKIEASSGFDYEYEEYMDIKLTFNDTKYTLVCEM